MKTKTTSILISLILLVSLGMAQQINYNKGPVKLIPEPTFLPNADWEALFYDGSQSSTTSKLGLDKQVFVGPGEKVYISDRYNFTISILDNTGRLVKTFGKKGYNDGEFAGNQDFDGILKSKLLVVSDCQGRINFFDLNGNFVKLITLDFMPLNIFPLKSGNLIVWGHVPVSGNRSKDVLAEIDYESGKYKVFYEKTESNVQPDRIVIPIENYLTIVGAPHSGDRTMVRVTDDDRIIVGQNNTDVVKVYSKVNGKYQESSFQIKATRIKITEQEKEEYYQNFKEKLAKKGIDTSYAEKAKAKDFYPDYLPNYYNMIVDNENNSLFFIYTNNIDEDYAFRAYSLNGDFLGQSEFKIEGYDLLSKLSSFTFKDGYIYTKALKQNEEFPLRIIKCKVGE
jgi:hypothetical protein